ncbi:DUF1223 domain-containing protein [Chachezhania sediminis]|uniref:DUF1223 domain-containing protein n=1 Tax=Chachezhania sediminis TaxID=2599291 RepID=UPI00131AB4B6|nr:DUF1223 domain-containing protein [Chachezhania sediminis]
MTPTYSFRSALISLALGVSAMQAAADPEGTAPVVVELFTSQGCSSCPKADKLLHALAERDDVLPLALHVDYWDYLGWQDDLADPAFSARQRAYAHHAGRDMIYTPQMVVMGQEDVVGARGGQLAELLAQHAAAAPVARVTAVRNGADVSVEVTPLAALAAGAGYDVQIVSYEPLRRVQIAKGENAGREIDYANIVTDWRTIAHWDGQGPAKLTATVAEGRPAAVIVQEPGPGAIVASARVD